MKTIYPSVEHWQNKGNIDHVARCARVCYASDKTTGNEKMYESLGAKGHTSMYRHESHYWVIPFKECPNLPDPNFICIRKDHETLYISANGDWCRQHSNIVAKLAPYEVNEWELIGTRGELCIRKTFAVITQISTSRELNRVSPNNIAEQSTRYVDFGKKGGITICLPHYYDSLSKFHKWVCRVYWKFDELVYNLKLKWGLLAQDAREDLPLCTATKCVYTYSLKEWGHILNLRYWGTTGKPHPNVKIVAGMIREQLIAEGFKQFEQEFPEKVCK